METSQNATWHRLDFVEISDDVLTFDQLVMFEGGLSLVRAVISVFGIIGNAINIMTFISMGIKDGFSLSMTILAGIELLHVIVIFVRSILYWFFIAEYATKFSTWFLVEPFGLYFYFGHSARLLYSLAVQTTTFLSFARCMCVSRPLQFKDMFSVFKSVVIISLVITISVGCYIPLLMTMALNLQFDPRINCTRIIFSVTPGREQVRVVTWIVRNAAFPISILIAMVFCVFHMTRKLTDSIKFRLKPQPLSPFIKPKISRIEIISKSLPVNSDLISKLTSSDVNKATVLKGKERRAIQQMLVLSLVVIICDVPEIIISFVSILMPSFGLLKALNNIYLAVIGVNHTFQVVNSSLNIFIYCKFSSRYRENCCLTKRNVSDARFVYNERPATPL